MHFPEIIFLKIIVIFPDTIINGKCYFRW